MFNDFKNAYRHVNVILFVLLEKNRTKKRVNSSFDYMENRAGIVSF